MLLDRFFHCNVPICVQWNQAIFQVQRIEKLDLFRLQILWFQNGKRLLSLQTNGNQALGNRDGALVMDLQRRAGFAGNQMNFGLRQQKFWRRRQRRRGRRLKRNAVQL